VSRAKLAIVGGGNMGEALVAGLLDAGWGTPAELVVVEPSEQRRAELASAHPGLRICATAVPADGAVLAVKPPDVESACRSLAGTGVARCLSIAAGVRLANLQGWLGPDIAVLRAMPNTPALVRAAATGLSAGEGSSEEDLAWASEILGAVGTVVHVSERSLDAVTGLSGSGPAYLFLVAEALVDAGVLAGLTQEVSAALVVQTMLGAGRLLAESGEPPSRLRAAVTSPGGTTAAGLAVLEVAAVRAAFVEAVAAATSRSAELGQLAPEP
jgi:pyrroline-5-carboxylate reductase